VRLIGNFDVEQSGKSVYFSSTGWWYNHFQGDSINVTNENMVISLRPGEFALYTSKKLEGFRNVTSSGPEVFSQPNGVKVFPNPVKDEVFLEGNTGQQIEKIVLYDFSGRVVLQKKLWGKNSFDVSFLPGGMYILEVLDNQSNRSWHKLVKE
jgi:hypothetical protein